MGRLINKIMQLRWHDSDNINYRAIQGQSGQFDLFLNQTLVGTLKYEKGQWSFSYSEEFKHQTKYEPLTNFPQMEKTYVSSDLWPFFSSRLPGSAQLNEADIMEDPISLLKKYGRHVITNPYTLVSTAIG